jgi:hypothetical protein
MPGGEMGGVQAISLFLSSNTVSIIASVCTNWQF